ncbi:MAG TPA: hypothetical protein VGD78_06420 [Chthoniobacterales bacterium]
MATNPPLYPQWQREGRVSRFFLGPGLSVYEVEEVELIGGALFVASTLDTRKLVGQFESEKNARQACTRDFNERARAGAASPVANRK